MGRVRVGGKTVRVRVWVRVMMQMKNIAIMYICPSPDGKQY